MSAIDKVAANQRWPLRGVPLYITYTVTLPVLNVASLELGPTPAMLMVETVSVYSVSSSSPAKVS